MFYYSLSAIINAFTSTIVGIVVLTKNPKSELNRSFSFFSFSVAYWSYSYFMWQISEDASGALFWSRSLMAGAIFIPPLFLYYSVIIINEFQKYFKLVLFWLAFSLVLCVLNFTPLIVKDVVPKLFFPFWPTPGIMFVPFILEFIGLTLFAHVLLIKYFIKSTGLKRNQLKYIILGSALGFLGGSTNFLLWFNIPIPPFGNVLVSIYVFLVAYAIIRYRLMNITLAITSAWIFLCVYTLVLGLPFWLGYGKELWKEATWLMFILATVGPFIFLYLKRKAESQLLLQELKIEHLLSQASYGMNRVHELNRLLKLIIKLVIKLLRVKTAALYLLNSEGDKYVLMEPIRDRATNAFIDSGNVLAQYLMETKFPLVVEEIHMHSLIKNKHVSSKDIEAQMRLLSAHVIVPIAVDDTLLGFLALGERKEKKIFRQELLNTLSILGNQAALVIENCQFMEAEKERLKKEGAQARRESLDMMVGTMAHEIDNPLAFVIGEAEYLEFLIKSDQYQLPPEFLAAITKSCGQIISGSWRVSKIIKAVEDYSKAESGQNKAVYIHNVMIPLRSLLLLLGKNYPGIPLTEEIEPELPPMWAEEVTIEEIIYNYVENSYHAVRRLPRGQPWVKLRIYRKEDMIVIEVSDNGYGIEARILKQLFQVPTTTKGSAEGTGLGLYRARQIVDKLKGRAWAESEGRDKGSKFFAEIPIFKGDPALANKEPPRRAF